MKSRRYNELWNKVNLDLDMQLSLEEVEKAISLINVEKSKKEIQDVFKQFDKNGNGSLEKDEFVCMLDELTKRKDVDELFF